VSAACSDRGPYYRWRPAYPYDLWQKGRRIELSVSALFPILNAIVVRQLDHACYDDLYPAHQALLAHNEKLLLERQTIEFILRTVFSWTRPELMILPAGWSS